MIVKQIFIKFLQWGIRWRRRCLIRLLFGPSKRIRPLKAKKRADGFRATVHIADEWATAYREGVER